eukprot:jgi/Botrbrau1/18078/Bobra.0062s0064.1
MVVIVAVMSNTCMDCRFYLPCTFLCIWTHSPLTPGIMFYDMVSARFDSRWSRIDKSDFCNQPPLLHNTMCLRCICIDA